MTLIMKAVNLTPDSFWAPSRICASAVLEAAGGADILDIGAVSTRPGAAPVSPGEEWRRLLPALALIAREGAPCRISLDTSRAQTVRRAYDLIGPFIVNDVSCGEDPQMLRTVAELGLTFVAMHHRGNPRTMDSLCDYGPEGVVKAVDDFFGEFAAKAARLGIGDWILDPGMGFAKTDSQNMEILNSLESFRHFGKPVLVGIADKRFTRGRTAELERLAIRHGADILRVHNI